MQKAKGMTAAELKVDSGLTTTQDVINSWCQITLSQHQLFVEGVTNTSVKIFSSPNIEAELSAAMRKKRQETQLTTFNKLQALTADKLMELDKFTGLNVCVRYEVFAERVKGIKFSRLLRQGHGPPSKAPTTNAPSTLRTPQYKPIESFLDSRHKSMP